MGHIITGAPWDVLAMDYLGPLPETRRGNKYILVLTDLFTKYVEVLPVPNQTAEDCTMRILNEFVSRWGTPLAIHSDRGSAFESKIFKNLCRLLEVKKTRTSPRNPQGNGQTERFNKTLVKMVKAYLTGEQDEWDLHLGCIAGAYRSTPSETTKLTPNLLSIGREVRLPADLIFGHKNSIAKPAPEYTDHVQDLKERMQYAHEIARQHLSHSTKRSKEIYDVKLSFHNYTVGDAVWCLHETRQVGVTPKLEKKFDGPFLIKVKRSDLNFVIQLDGRGQQRVVHHNKLKPYEGKCLPKWMEKARRASRGVNISQYIQ